MGWREELTDREYAALLEVHIEELYELLDKPLRQRVVEDRYLERLEKKKAPTPVKESGPDGCGSDLCALCWPAKP